MPDGYGIRVLFNKDSMKPPYKDSGKIISCSSSDLACNLTLDNIKKAPSSESFQIEYDKFRYWRNKEQFEIIEKAENF